MFDINVGTVDRALRILIGALLIVGALMGYGLWMWIGVVPLLTGLMRRCPLYSLFGLSTCPHKPS
ncbi:DUF2892 domain-containing protein [Cognatishimia sp. SS12]|uniref:YgaP family membrane protein n=1 Tax=Cognatishimia sp. SS12 TaxID=2979465 RepID=UPI00232C0DB8|nr:DUF2892 domain-containing protein [Cognatishimia sp. SS12]MDC0737480.1 DUF2892 domain-containing protein [Cognatishimia sp. SS12]